MFFAENCHIGGWNAIKANLADSREYTKGDATNCVYVDHEIVPPLKSVHNWLPLEPKFDAKNVAWKIQYLFSGYQETAGI